MSTLAPALQHAVEKNDWVCSGMCMMDSRKDGILSLCMHQRAVIGKLCLTSESQTGFLLL